MPVRIAAWRRGMVIEGQESLLRFTILSPRAATTALVASITAQTCACCASRAIGRPMPQFVSMRSDYKSRRQAACRLRWEPNDIP